MKCLLNLTHDIKSPAVYSSNRQWHTKYTAYLPPTCLPRTQMSPEWRVSCMALKDIIQLAQLSENIVMPPLDMWHWKHNGSYVVLAFTAIGNNTEMDCSDGKKKKKSFSRNVLASITSRQNRVWVNNAACRHVLLKKEKERNMVIDKKDHISFPKMKNRASQNVKIFISRLSAGHKMSATSL